MRGAISAGVVARHGNKLAASIVVGPKPKVNAVKVNAVKPIAIQWFPFLTNLTRYSRSAII
ncbi:MULTISPECIES: hypothetical protein [Limosilactobacillus]|uniref:hypothetical protein n=1 Tax=Limosilactobacillus sp. DJ3M12 TaxID=2991835 RepID=UPI0021F092FD|nr:MULTISPECIES: hypothetical protein [Limosilactobacillus]MDM8244751.1 hypothetical protein [Limosilactobacillus vaginalis]